MSVTGPYATEQAARDAAAAKSSQLAKTGAYVGRAKDFGCDGYAMGDREEECEGWDGNSSRCECGNRRIMWSYVTDHTREKWWYYPEAY